MMPKVSVIMPVYNRGNHFLRNSTESVLSQSFSDFEFLILDDGSTDDSLAIIKQYAEKDQRIRILQNTQNRGIPFSTNRLLDSVKTDFVALLDSDDTCYPYRLKKQYEFFQNNPDIDIIGGQPQLYRLPTSDWEIKTTLCFYGSVFINASTMMRMKNINRHNIRYNPDIPFSQDYQLWVDCLPFVKFANLSEVLIKTNEHVNQAGKQNIARQRADHIRTLRIALQRHNIQSPDHRTLITLLGWQESTLKKQDIQNVVAYIIGLLGIKDFHGYSGVNTETLRWMLSDLCGRYAHKSTREISMLTKEILRMTTEYESIRINNQKTYVLKSYARKLIRLIPGGQQVVRFMRKIIRLVLLRRY